MSSAAVKTKRVLMLETFYPDFIKAHPIPNGATYDESLAAILSRGFGTGSVYSANLRRLGWKAIDVIVNHHDLQQMWADENYSGQGRRGEYIIELQIEKYRPDVVFCHDLSVLDVGILERIRSNGILLAGHCSCPMPDLNKVARFDLLTTSFPYYVKRFEALGVKAFYVPLGFDESVIERHWVSPDGIRPNDCVFVGGVGAPSHWKYGMEVLNAIAASIPTFKWWGYGADLLPKASALRQKYQGEAFGNAMYDILKRSRVCVNRHGEVAGPYANNQRLFEVPGTGCMLITDSKENLGDFFEPDEVIAYKSPSEAAGLVKYYIEHEDERQKIAWAGHRRVMRDHTYSQRMKQVSEILASYL